MYQDKTLVCKDCGAEFIFLQGNRSSMQRRAFKMSLHDVNHVEMLEKLIDMVATERCMMPYVQIAEQRQRFPLCHAMTDLYTAVIA